MVIIMSVLTIFVFNLFLNNGSLEKARAGAFAVMAITQLFNVFNMRSLSLSVFKIGFFSNKFIVVGMAASFALMLIALFVEKVAGKFGFDIISVAELLIIILLSSLVLFFCFSFLSLGGGCWGCFFFFFFVGGFVWCVFFFCGELFKKPFF